MEPGVYAEARKQREQAFHDDAFARNARQAVWKYHAVTVWCRERYTELIMAYGAGKRVLEYGCGPDSYAKALASNGAQVTSIDISSTAVEKARARAEELGLADHMTFQVMDAENLTFADESFDLVCGTSVLHHLDLTRAYTEISRVLVPEGRAVFTEPLGSNKLINLYRRRTPHLRTVDEHPLMPADFTQARQFFKGVSVSYFNLVSLAAVPFRNTPVFPYLLSALDNLDAVLFTIPAVRTQAWMSLIVLSHPY
jgi:SAM-dependent methyltransferase